MDIDEMYTIEDLAKKFKVTPETVRRWCREGKIKYAKLPGPKGEYRFSKEALSDFVAMLNSQSIADEERILKDNKDKE